MAGIELNTVSAVNTTAQQVSSDAPVRESIRRTEIKPEEATKVQSEDSSGVSTEEELDNVVARSKDGDTVQVSDDGATELEESLEGAVIAETDAQASESRREYDFEIEAPEVEVVEVETPQTVLPKEDTSDANAEPPFGKYTSQQLEMMYQQGAISPYNYNAELERRENILKAAMGEAEEFSRDMGVLNETSRRVEQVDFAVKSAINSESKIDLSDRLKAVDTATEKTKTQARVTEEEGRLWDYQLRA